MKIPIGRIFLSLLDVGKTVPVSQIRLLRRISIGDNSLFPRNTPKENGKNLRHPALRRALADDEMGIWSMSPVTLNFIEAELHRQVPEHVLEFGSGLSTVCLAQYMRDLHGVSDHTRVYSIEQDAGSVAGTLERLRSLHLEDNVRIFHAPLANQSIEGRKTLCYALPSEFILALKEIHPTFVIIDGPAAEDGARFGTLPLVRELIPPGTRFYLDDALRDSEIEISEAWSALPWVRIEGIHPTEKGLLSGVVI